MHTVGVIQPNFVPWRGYFDFIRQVDTFIFHDDIQYTKQDWRNRNRIKVPQGVATWLTVPVSAKTDTLIMDTKINYDTDWVRKHLAVLAQNYRTAPHLKRYLPRLREIFEARYEYLADLDIALTEQICDWLGITTRLIRASDLNCTGVKDDKLLQMMKKIGGTHYLSGPAAKAYIQPELWAEAGIGLAYIDYPAYPSYPQVSDVFEPAVTVLDLLFMTGPEAPAYIWDTSHEHPTRATQNRPAVQKGYLTAA